MSGNNLPAFLPFLTNPGSGINTFSCENFSPSNVDVNYTQAQGFQFYPYRFFGQSSSLGPITFPGDGTVILYNQPICTMVISGVGSPKYHGTTFGGGGYFEAAFSFDPSQVSSTSPSFGFPAWWAMAAEHFTNDGSDQWPGQIANFNHFSELDFFEYFKAGSNYYGSTIQDWYGVYSGTYSTYRITSYCSVNDAIFNNKNYYGCLWVPATATTNGFVQYFFNRQPVGDVISWSQFTNISQLPPPSAATPWAFGIIDSQHMNLILNGGSDCPMKLYSVNVWQPSTAFNIVQ